MRLLLKRCVPVVALVVLYCASDFYAKGALLNTALPVPLLGWLFWALLAFVMADAVVRPVVLFRRLTRAHGQSVESAAAAVRRRLSEKGEKNELFWKINGELVKSLPKKSPEHAARAETLSRLVGEYYNSLSPDASKIIRKYSWKAALCVVFSRNGLVDGVLMFHAQVKMAMELMRLYGYRLSPLFNVLCFFWIASNSALNGIFSQAGADSVGEILGGMLSDGGLVGEGIQSQVAAKAGSFVVEALASATTVYVTGEIINRKLRGEAGNVSIKELFKMRRAGRAALLADIPEAAKENVRQLFC